MNVLYGAQSEGPKKNNYLTRERGNHRENLSGLIYSRNKYICHSITFHDRIEKKRC